MKRAFRLLVGCFVSVSLVGCRSDKPSEPTAMAAEPAPPPKPVPMPAGRPLFAWRAPVSVPVDQAGDSRGKRIRTHYWLDVCPSADGGRVLRRRDLRIVSINGTPPSAEVRKKAEGIAEGLPEITVDLSGAFVRKDANTDWMVSNLWQGWTELWLHVDPAGSNPQDVAAAGIENGAPAHVSFVSMGDDHRAKFHARRELTKDDVWELTKDDMMPAGFEDYEITKMVRSAEEVLDIETDWPELRPWVAHSRKTVHFTSQTGPGHDFVEEREYLFDWRSAGQENPKCVSPDTTP